MNPNALLVPPPLAQAFTPSLVGTSTPGTATYAADGQMGRYIKSGQIAFVWIRLEWTAHTGTGDLQINGLPFAAASFSGARFILQALPSNLTYSNDIVADVPSGQTIVRLRTYSTGAASAAIAMDTAGFVQVQGFYLTDV